VRLREGHDENVFHLAAHTAPQPELTQEKRLAGAINHPRLRSNSEFSVRHYLGLRESRVRQGTWDVAIVGFPNGKPSF
jgi:hypothetical protein